MKFDLFLFLSIVSGVTMAQSTGPFTSTGNMATPRYAHTATLLLDGRVLIAGGRGEDPGNPTLASAELYDPSSHGFTPTGGMTIARAGHTATLLADGRVLMVGSQEREAELYDPATGTFTATGNTILPRAFGHTATLLRDGRVLIADGFWWGGVTGDVTAEIYDPSTGTFTATESMHSPSGDAATGTLLPDSTVLIGTEVYHPSTGTFTDTGHPGHDYGYSATLMMDGKVFIAGGGDSDPEKCFSQTELFDPTTGTFAAAPRMTLCRITHTATLLPNGIVLIAGGASYDAGPYQANLDSVEIYDFSTRTFGWIGNMIVGRQAHTATLLPDGRVLIAGGVGTVEARPYAALSSAEIYSPPALVAAPELLSLSGTGRGPGAIQHADTYQVVSADNPAVPGEALILYCTGLADRSVIPPQVAIGGRMAEILFFGNTPEYSGLNQVNLRVPSGVSPGSAVPVSLTYLGRSSNQVTLGIR